MDKVRDGRAIMGPNPGSLEKPKRFRVLWLDEAVKLGCLEEEGYNDRDDVRAGLFDFSTTPPTLVATDGMEPEDASFHRDLKWVPELLNKIASEK